MEEPEEELDDEAEEALEDDNSESNDDGDGKEPSGESLQSQDTPRRGGEPGDTSNDLEDDSYDPNEPLDVAEGSTELELSSKEEEDESIDSEEIQQLCNANAEWNEAQERDAEVTARGINAAQISEVEAVHTLGERNEAETRVPTKAEAPNLEVLGTAVAAFGTKSSTLSFGWAMADWDFTAGTDGFYYDPEGMRYPCSREGGQYTYEQVTSVLQGALDGDHVPSPLADAMVTRALD
jgi:hypothetical protein